MSARILVVEDEPGIREVVALRARGAGSRSRRRGRRDALERAREESFDVVILDVMLPSMSGIEVCRQLRSESTCRS